MQLQPTSKTDKVSWFCSRFLFLQAPERETSKMLRNCCSHISKNILRFATIQISVLFCFVFFNCLHDSKCS